MTGLTLRFANSAPPPGVSEGDLWVVLDPAWTESVGGRRDAVVGLRSLAAAVLERQDLFPRTSELLDTWQEASGIAGAFAIGGTSYWFRRRLTVWRWLHERLIWLAILDELASRKPFGAIELPALEEPALREVSALYAAGHGLVVRGDARDQPLDHAAAADDNARDSIPLAGAPPESGPLALLKRVVRSTGIRAADRRRNRLLDRRGAIDGRLRRLLEEGRGRLLVLADPATYQEIVTPQGRRVADPFLGSIVDRLRGSNLDPVVLELDTRVSDDVAWARLTSAGSERTLPGEVLARHFGEAGDDEASRQAAGQIAATVEGMRTPLDASGVDLGPDLMRELVRYARDALDARLRETARAIRLLDALRPAALLLVNEYGRTEWLAAARAAGVPVGAVQHGVIHRWHPGYIHASRSDNLALPDRTYVFGNFDRRLLQESSVYRPEELRVVGSPRLDLVPAQRPNDDARQMRTTLGVQPGERLLVVSTTFAGVLRRFYSPVVIASLLGGRVPDARIVIKLHPGERDGQLYLDLLNGLGLVDSSAARDVAIVKHVDLYRLLAAADAHLGIYSTVLTEAVVTGTRNLLATTLATSDLLGYMEAGVAEPVRTADDIAAALASPVPMSEDRRRAFLADHFEPGSAAEKVADDLEAWVGRTAREATASPI